MNFSLPNQAAAGAPQLPSATTPTLPELRRPRPRGSRGLKGLLIVLLLVGGGAAFVAFGLPGVSKSVGKMFAASPAENVLAYPVKRGPMDVIVNERGSLESSNSKDVMNQVEGSTSIISIKPEGTRVKAGEVVCELDSSSLRDQLSNQQITTKSAESAFENAKLTHEVAEIAVSEYKEGIYKLDLDTAEGEIKLAESELTRARDRVEWSRRMYQKGYVSKAQMISDELSLERMNFNLEQSQSKLSVLKAYTYKKTVKELEAEVEKAKTDKLAKEATFALEKSKEDKLVRQINHCILKAPADGLVVYANDPNRFGGQQIQIEEGAAVRERQKIFSLPDISKMRVNTKVHESMVDRITPGLVAQIKVDAFPDLPLDGNVESVQPLPDPNSFFSSDIKVYTTLVSIKNGHQGLRPGMTAQVEILVKHLENVLAIPAQAITSYQGKDHVAVLTPNGYVQREVTLGTTNDRLVEVLKGLGEGDVVALNPTALMSETEKRAAFGVAGTGGAARKNWGGVGGPPGAGGGPPEAGGVPPGAGGPPGAAGKTKGKGAGGARRKMDPAMLEKFKNMSPEEKAQMKARMQGGGFGGPPGGGGFGGGPPGGGGLAPSPKGGSGQ